MRAFWYEKRTTTGKKGREARQIGAQWEKRILHQGRLQSEGSQKGRTCNIILHSTKGEGKIQRRGFDDLVPVKGLIKRQRFGADGRWLGKKKTALLSIKSANN